MKNLKHMVPSGIAVLAAGLFSWFIPGDVPAFLASFAVLVLALVLALAGCVCPRHSRWRIQIATVFPAVLFAAIVGSFLPLRLAFYLHRADFDQVALQIDQGNPPATPFWIGPFKIQMVGHREDSGILYLATNRDSSEIKGFVRHPDGYGFNLWSRITLDEAWSYIAED